MIWDAKNPDIRRTHRTRKTIRRNRFILLLLCVFLWTTSAHSDEAIDIAAIYALTGPAAEGNAWTLRGIRHAVDEINKHGGVLGRDIKLWVFDNKSTPIGSTVAANQAVAAGVVGIVGSDWSSHSIAVARVAQHNKIPMISSLSTNPQVTKIGDYIFRICFTDDFQGQIIAKFARQDLSAETAVVFVDVTSDYSLNLSEIFKKNFEKLGGKILLELEYKLKQQHFDEDVKRAAATDVDLMFFPGHDESGSIAKQAQQTGTTAIFLGGDGWSTPSFFRKGGAELKQGYYSAHWSANLDTERSRLFVKKYVHSEISAENMALGYDALMLMADAITRSGAIDRKKIKDAIANTRDFEGVTGTINFNDWGDPIKSAVFMEIRNGVPHYLKTMKP